MPAVRNVHLDIAQRFNAGFRISKIKSPIRDGRNILSSLKGLVPLCVLYPSVKTLGYCSEF